MICPIFINPLGINGYHRYVFRVYKQEGRLNKSELEAKYSYLSDTDNSRGDQNLTFCNLEAALELNTPAVAGTMFKAKHE